MQVNCISYEKYSFILKPGLLRNSVVCPRFLECKNWKIIIPCSFSDACGTICSVALPTSKLLFQGKYLCI